ncbi:MAG TPA: nuclear transport factor 2 family protein [Solirubrobacterales bacterium]|nr:nuclear transport factor 2 family protein [Solirubrobacterales bacterium]
MSQENVEIVQEAIEAFNRGDFETALKRMHPDIEWQTLDTFPDAETYHGHEEVREFWQTWRDTFRGFRLHLEECVAVGERHVLATFRVSGEGTGSGVAVESPAVFQLGEMRDGQVIRVGMFSHEGEALEAAGLSE